MAIWDSLLKRIISPVVNKSIKEVKKEEELQKGLATLAPPWRFQPIGEKGGVVRRTLPRGVKFQTLRDFSLYYPILRACINYRKRQITQLKWDVSSVEVITDKKKKEKYKKDAKEIKKILKYPAGDKSLTFRGFVNKIIEDLLVLDAVAIYRRRNKGGGIYGYLPIDATTIELMLYDDGTIPVPPDEAYQQKISGEVKAELTTNELIYKMMNPRTDTPYGLSPVEALIIVITTALKLSSYNLSYLTEGNIPEGLVELPEDIISSPDQLKAWQAAWDTMFSGDPRYQRKIKFLPAGIKLHPTRKIGEMQFERFEKWLLQNTCSVLELPPQAIGFQFERGKGAVEAEWEIGKERGLFPTANFLKELFDQIIQEDLKMPHLEFVWSNINPTNRQEEANVFSKLVNAGAVSVDEWRLGEGLDTIGCPHYIMTPVGPIFVSDLVARSEAGESILPQSYQPSNGSPKPPKNVPQKIQRITQNVPEKIQQITRDEIVKELKRWKKVVSNDIKQGKEFRDFQTNVIDTRTKNLIKNGLRMIKTKDQLNQLFDPLISQENQMIAALLDLYDEVSSIVRYDEATNTKKSSKSN